jgi:hypothetical protein
MEQQRDRGAADAPPYETYASGVSWAAVMGGAFVAASLSLILLALGTGLGLSSVSPWSNTGASAAAVGAAAIAWLVFMQIISSAMGGYLAGRLRTRWSTIHSDEVYFRDTAHGFLAWAVAIVITAAFLTSAAVSLLGGASRHAEGEGTSIFAGNPSHEGRSSGAPDYFVDALLRSDHPLTDANDGALRAETGRLFAHALAEKDTRAPDEAYLAQLVAAKTGLSQSDAQKRVSDTLEQARQAEEKARKAAAHLSIWMFVALLAGAFCASFAATIGGRQRDHVKPV